MECFPVILRWWIIIKDEALEQSKFVLRVLSSVLCGGSRNRVALMRPTSPVDHGLTFLCPWVPPSDSLTIDFLKTKALGKSTVNVTASFAIGRYQVKYASDGNICDSPYRDKHRGDGNTCGSPNRDRWSSLTWPWLGPDRGTPLILPPWKSVNVIALHPIRRTETTFPLWPTIDPRRTIQNRDDQKQSCYSNINGGEDFDYNRRLRWLCSHHNSASRLRELLGWFAGKDLVLWQH